MRQPGRVTGRQSEAISRFCVAASRVLLVITALLMAVTPVTEHFWNFDGFLRGGQDLESGLLCVLCVLCLVLLLAHCCRETLTLLISLREWFSFRPREQESRNGLASVPWLSVEHTAARGPDSAAFCTPLLI